jgi:hypothetical protein
LDKNKDNTYISNESESDFVKLEKKLEDRTKILDYFKKLPLYIEEDNFLLIH